MNDTCPNCKLVLATDTIENESICKQYGLTSNITSNEIYDSDFKPVKKYDYKDHLRYLINKERIRHDVPSEVILKVIEYIEHTEFIEISNSCFITPEYIKHCLKKLRLVKYIPNYQYIYDKINHTKS